MPVTMFTAASLAAILLVLSVRISAIRRSARISMGDGNNPELLSRIRAQANCTEYAPIGLVMLLLAEQHFGASWFVMALAGLLLAGRILHPIGMAMAAPNAPRVLGMVGTWSAIGVLGLLLLWGAIAG